MFVLVSFSEPYCLLGERVSERVSEWVSERVIIESTTKSADFNLIFSDLEDFPRDGVFLQSYRNTA